MQPVKGHDTLLRDNRSGAIINTNSTGAQAARKAIKKHKEDQARLNKLENDVSDIKHMLKQLLEK